MSIEELEKQQKKLKKQIHQKKREQIIDIAYKMFREKGIENTTVDQIAKKAGISKGTLYNHYFNRKEGIILEIAIRAYSKLTSMFRMSAEISKPGIDQVTEMGRQYYKFAKENPTYRQSFDLAGSLIDVSELFERKSPKQLKKTVDIIKKFQQANVEFVKVWAEIIANAQKVGEVTREFNSVQIAYVLGTITTGLVDEILQREKSTASVGLSNEQVLEIAIRFLKKGLQ